METIESKHIAIVGLGPSSAQYLDIVKRQGGRHKFCDEVWSINALGDVFASDLIFHMDDIRIQEVRAAASPDSNIAAMVNWIKTNHAALGGWQDRTGNLTNSISYQEAQVTESGSIRGVIYAGMSYAIYVEWKEGHWVLSGAFTEYHEKIMRMLARYVREQQEAATV